MAKYDWFRSPCRPFAQPRDSHEARPRALRFLNARQASSVAAKNLTRDNHRKVGGHVLALNVQKTMSWVKDARELHAKPPASGTVESCKSFNANMYKYMIESIPAYEDFEREKRCVDDTQPHTGAQIFAQPIRTHSMHARCVKKTTSTSSLSVYAKNKLESPKQDSCSMPRLPCVLD